MTITIHNMTNSPQTDKKRKEEKEGCAQQKPYLLINTASRSNKCPMGSHKAKTQFIKNVIANNCSKNYLVWKQNIPEP